MKKTYLIHFNYRIRRRFLWKWVWGNWQDTESTFFVDELANEPYGAETLGDRISKQVELIAIDHTLRKVPLEHIDIYIDKIQLIAESPNPSGLERLPIDPEQFQTHYEKAFDAIVACWQDDGTLIEYNLYDSHDDKEAIAAKLRQYGQEGRVYGQVMLEDLLNEHGLATLDQ